MLAGFLWMAFAYSGRNSGYDYRAKRDTFSNEEGNQFDFITFQNISYIKDIPKSKFSYWLFRFANLDLGHIVNCCMDF